MQISTEINKQVIDITERVEKEVPSGLNGLCHVFVAHTTAAIATADLDPGTDLDMLDALDALIPKLQYRHPHNPDHVGDHIMSSIIGPDVTVPVRGGKMILGNWQRIVLVELDGPRERDIHVTCTAKV